MLCYGEKEKPMRIVKRSNSVVNVIWGSGTRFDYEAGDKISVLVEGLWIITYGTNHDTLDFDVRWR